MIGGLHSQGEGRKNAYVSEGGFDGFFQESASLRLEYEEGLTLDCPHLLTHHGNGFNNRLGMG